MRISAFIGAVAAISSQANGATPVRLAPSTPWVVDYAENSCRLVRRFGEGKDLTTFALESEAPGAVDMMIVGKPLATVRDEVPARFLPVQAKPMKGIPAESTDKRDPVVLWSSSVRLLPDDFADALAKRSKERQPHPGTRPPAESLAEQAERKAKRQAFLNSATAIEIDARRPVILETGSLGEPFKMFDQCSRDSLRDWGVDPDVDDKIVRRVWTLDAGRWFSPNDYPRDMLLSLKESIVKVRALVDATGRITKCTSLSHFTETKFGQIACDKFMAKAHFEPAELADGTKVPSYYVNKVVFKIAN